MHMNGKISFTAWLGLFRVTNLLIIILTQVLAWHFIIRPLYELFGLNVQLPWLDFTFLVIATVFIAAGGYIVNDIYDIDVDDYNKRRNIIGKQLSINSAWIVYFILNLIAFILGFYLALQAGSFQLGFVFVVIAGMLYLYSSRYQNKLLWGNIIVSLTSAMVILIVWLFEFMYLRNNPDAFIDSLTVMPIISAVIWPYALFAFLASLVREFIKDTQDIEGDTRFGSYTLAIAVGVPAMKIIISAGIAILMILLAVGQYYLLKHGFRYAFWYLILTVQFMFAYLLFTIIKAKSPKGFSTPSQLAKLIMLAGVLSMQLMYLDIS